MYHPMLKGIYYYWESKVGPELLHKVFIVITFLGIICENAEITVPGSCFMEEK